MKTGGFVVLSCLLSLPAYAEDSGEFPGPADAVIETPSVVGGQPVTHRGWPDAVGILFDSSSPSCTGVLVAPNVVLTARHCLGGITDVLINSVDWRDDPGEVIAVARSYGHPSVDLAALVLESSSAVKPRIIATGCAAENDLFNGAEAAIVGYGAIDESGNEYSTELREAFTTITDSNCSQSSGCTVQGGELGAGGGGVDACFGDSGGPLYLLTEHIDYVVGITSRAYSGTSLPCRYGGIWVRPDYAVEWIEEVTGVNMPRTTCNIPPTAPGGIRITVDAGDTAVIKVPVEDGNPGDTHSFFINAQPANGEAGTNQTGDRVLYKPADGFLGEDTFVFRTVDNGVPAMESVTEVTVEVVEGCGCSTSSPRPTSLAAALLILGLVVRPRRRRRRRGWPLKS